MILATFTYMVGLKIADLATLNPCLHTHVFPRELSIFKHQLAFVMLIS